MNALLQYNVFVNKVFEEELGYFMRAECVRCVLNAFEPLLTLDPSQCDQIGKTVGIPTIPEEIISDLCTRTIEVLKQKSTLLEIKSPIYIVGDLHGNLLDLLRIFIFSKTPPLTRFLFLGDYVDRGQFSVEIICLLFAFSCAYPNHIFLLRGNHEFEHVNQNYGFANECKEQFGNLDLWNAINNVFTYLPLTAIINNELFCVHGGISPQITSLKALVRVKRPLATYDKDDLVCDLVWSDPSSETQDYLRSNRGSGVTFGTTSISEFFKLTKMKHIIRAHQCVSLGIERFDGDHVYTVFSCSNYADFNGNKCGLLFITPQSDIQSFSLPIIAPLDRQNCLFVDLDDDATRHESLALNLQMEDIAGSKMKNSSALILNVGLKKRLTTIRALSNDNIQKSRLRLQKLPRLSS